MLRPENVLVLVRLGRRVAASWASPAAAHRAPPCRPPSSYFFDRSCIKPVMPRQSSYAEPTKGSMTDSLWHHPQGHCPYSSRAPKMFPQDRSARSPFRHMILPSRDVRSTVCCSAGSMCLPLPPQPHPVHCGGPMHRDRARHVQVRRRSYW